MLDVPPGQRRAEKAKKKYIASLPHHWGRRYAVIAYLASRVRAITPAAMAAEREVSDSTRLQVSCGPSVICCGPDPIYLFIYLFWWWWGVGGGGGGGKHLFYFLYPPKKTWSLKTKWSILV